MSDDIDDRKRGSAWHRELHPNPVAFGKTFADRFEEALRAYGVKYKRTTDEYIENGGDSGWDFEVGRLTIDVKGTSYTNKINLLVEVGKVKAHIYVLYSQGFIEGFATNKDLLRHRPIKWPRNISNHIIPAEELRSAKILWNTLKESN